MKESIFTPSGIEFSGEAKIEDLKRKLSHEFGAEDTFTLEDVNDAFGNYTEAAEYLYTEDDLLKLVDEGMIYHNEDTGEYSFHKEFVLDQAA